MNALAVRIGTLIVAFGLGVGIGLKIISAPPAPVGSTVEAPPAPELKGIGTETVPCATVEAYKPEAKRGLSLPSAVQENPRQVVTSSTNISPGINPHRITSVLDVGTGKTTTYDQRLELPWLALDGRGEAGISYGQRGSERIVRLEARQSLFDLRAVRVGAVASLDQPLAGGRPDAFIGVGAWYRW